MHRTSKRLLAACALVGALMLSGSVPALAGDDGRGRDGGSRDGGGYGGGYDRGDRGLDCSSANSTRYRRTLNVIGYTANNRLICFNEKAPGYSRDIGTVTGLNGDASLVGIDVRPANNTLYGVGNRGGIYTINTSNAASTKVAQLSVALSGTNFGVDVNPAADALRVISDTGQNLRYSFATGVTFVDGALTYPPSTTPAMGVTGAGYTNNDSDPNTGTTLYDLDSTMDQVAIQSPANSGQLAATGKLTGDTGPQVGFDVYSTIRNGSTVDVQARASLTVGGQARFYSVTLFSGKAVDRGAFAARNQVIDIAIPTNQL